MWKRVSGVILVALLTCAASTLAQSEGGEKLAPSHDSAADPRALSDAVAKNIAGSRIDPLFEQMDATFRRSMTRRELAELVDLTHQLVGGIGDVRFRAAERGQRLDSGGQRTIWKFWYAARADGGNAFLWIEVVSDEGHYACSTFSAVTFTHDPPPNLLQKVPSP